jgi:hypothetical protein
VLVTCCAACAVALGLRRHDDVDLVPDEVAGGLGKLGGLASGKARADGVVGVLAVPELAHPIA